MECNHIPIDWSKLPQRHERTSFGDTNGNKLDITIDERVINVDASKIAMPTPEEMKELQKCEVASGVYRIV